MARYIIRRFIYMIVVIFIMTIVGYIIIELPPGDYLTSLVSSLQASGFHVDQATLEFLKRQYGLDLPPYQRYLKWMGRLLKGDFGVSMQWRKPVWDLLKERLALTIILSIMSTVFTYIIAIPVGIYSATHQYSVFDYIFTAIGFLGIAMPTFLLALIFMFLAYKYFNISVIGLFSPAFQYAPWSFAKFIDMLKHIWVPIIIISMSGTAGIIRIMRGCLLDELNKPYVITARAKGLPERKLLFKYPVRIAINPILSTIGWTLPGIISGESLASIVLGLPTTGPLFLDALRNQDMYLAGANVVLVCTFTVIGMFLSDLLLVWADPRIRYE